MLRNNMKKQQDFIFSKKYNHTILTGWCTDNGRKIKILIVLWGFETKHQEHWKTSSTFSVF